MCIYNTKLERYKEILIIISSAYREHYGTVLFKSSNDYNIVLMRIRRNFLRVPYIYIETANVVLYTQ